MMPAKEVGFKLLSETLGRYEDIKLETRTSIQDYTRERIGSSEVDGRTCIIVKATTIDGDTAKELGHSKREDCIATDIWFPLRSVQWDTKGRLLKTISFSDIRQVQGIWTAHTIKVENHKTLHKTKFVFSQVNYDEGIDNNVFNQANLNRGI
jgi:hypothetical protein